MTMGRASPTHAAPTSHARIDPMRPSELRAHESGALCCPDFTQALEAIMVALSLRFFAFVVLYSFTVQTHVQAAEHKSMGHVRSERVTIGERGTELLVRF